MTARALILLSELTIGPAVAQAVGYRANDPDKPGRDERFSLRVQRVEGLAARPQRL